MHGDVGFTIKTHNAMTVEDSGCEIQGLMNPGQRIAVHVRAQPRVVYEFQPSDFRGSLCKK
jgi:hypothetical protein